MRPWPSMNDRKTKDKSIEGRLPLHVRSAIAANDWPSLSRTICSDGTSTDLHLTTLPCNLIYPYHRLSHQSPPKKPNAASSIKCTSGMGAVDSLLRTFGSFSKVVLGDNGMIRTERMFMLRRAWSFHSLFQALESLPRPSSPLTYLN